MRMCFPCPPGSGVFSRPQLLPGVCGRARWQQVAGFGGSLAEVLVQVPCSLAQCVAVDRNVFSVRIFHPQITRFPIVNKRAPCAAAVTSAVPGMIVKPARIPLPSSPFRGRKIRSCRGAWRPRHGTSSLTRSRTFTFSRKGTALRPLADTPRLPASPSSHSGAIVK